MPLSCSSRSSGEGGRPKDANRSSGCDRAGRKLRILGCLFNLNLNLLKGFNIFHNLRGTWYIKYPGTPVSSRKKPDGKKGVHAYILFFVKEFRGALASLRCSAPPVKRCLADGAAARAVSPASRRPFPSGCPVALGIMATSEQGESYEKTSFKK